MFSMMLLLVSGLLPESPAPLIQPHDRIVWLGDSVTRMGRYTTYLEQELERRYPSYGLSFYNAGEDGDTSVDGRARFKRDVRDQRATLVFVSFGLNDVAELKGRFSEPAQGKYLESTRAILRGAREHGIRVVLLSPHCMAAQVPSVIPGSADLQARFYAPLAVLARAEGAFFIDVFSATRPRIENLAPREASRLLPDGVHPAEAGGKMIGDVILDALKAHS